MPTLTLQPLYSTSVIQRSFTVTGCATDEDAKAAVIAAYDHNTGWNLFPIVAMYIRRNHATVDTREVTIEFGLDDQGRTITTEAS